MNPHLAQQLASQHEDGLRRLAANSGHSSKARQARRGQSHRPHSMRRQAGWALISMGVRLAYTAGEE